VKYLFYSYIALLVIVLGLWGWRWGIERKGMGVNRERDSVSDKSYSDNWKDSLWFIVRWTVVILPFWVMSYHGVIYGAEQRLREFATSPRNEYVYYAGHAIMMACPTLGLAFSVFLKRKLWPSWAVFIGGSVAAVISFLVGSFAVVFAYPTSLPLF